LYDGSSSQLPSCFEVVAEVVVIVVVVVVVVAGAVVCGRAEVVASQVLQAARQLDSNFGAHLAYCEHWYCPDSIQVCQFAQLSPHGPL